MPRHDNIVQRVLSLSDSLMVSFIADGHHVPGFALSNYLKRVPDDNIVIVSDAISAAGGKRVDLQLGTGLVDRNETGQPFAKPFGGQTRTDRQVNASLFPEPVDQAVHEAGARRRNMPGSLGAKRVNDLNRGEVVGIFGRLVEAELRSRPLAGFRGRVVSSFCRGLCG